MENALVKLIIKTPNHDIGDQVVHCEVNWTVKDLKGHLTKVFPNKPKLEEQKIIYSGQLLNDHLFLKDVLNEQNSDTHTIHLVCPTFLPIVEKSPSVMPLQEESSQKQAPSRNISTAEAMTTANNSRQFSQQELMYQQMFMMYSQYMSQYMNYMQSAGIKTQNNVFNNIQHQESTIQQEQQQIVNNAVPPGIEEEENPRNVNDWMDWMHVVFHLLLFSSLIYYYSSAWRVFLVIIIGTVIYMRHVPFENSSQQSSQNESNEIANDLESEPIRASVLYTAIAFIRSLFSSIIPELPTN